MNTFDKIRACCRPFRNNIGIILIIVGVYTGIVWFYLGVIPLIVGIFDICPLCKFSGKCTPKNLK